MTTERLREASFYIPTRPDPSLLDGETPPEAWERLQTELLDHAYRWWVASHLDHSVYRDPEDGRRAETEARHYLAAVAESRLEGLRRLLGQACDWFRQRRIYLSVAGRVEFVGSPAR